MKRGRPSTTGINNAITIAKKRGCVMRVMYSSDCVCDFFIRTVTLVIFVRAVRLEKIILPVEEIERKCREIISELRLFPPSEQIQLEMWAYSKHGTYRFFRINSNSLEEIPHEGETPERTLPETTDTTPPPSVGTPIIPKLSQNTPTDSSSSKNPLTGSTSPAPGFTTYRTSENREGQNPQRA
jgi:hypothetical protein